MLDGKWKLVWINHVQRWELYNINEDRTETNDLASEFPEVVADLKTRWLDWARNNFVELQRVKQPEGDAKDLLLVVRRCQI